MAHQEQLAILQQGVAVWNQWRADHPDEPIDLRDANLFGADLAQINLAGANLFCAILSNANLAHAHLSGAILSGAILANANLTQACLAQAWLIGTQLNDETRIDPKWRLVWQIINYGAQDQDLQRADLSDANLFCTNLKAANLTGANLRGTNLSRAVLSHTILDYADLTGANLENANLENTRLCSVSLSHANLTGLNLQGQNLGGTSFHHAKLSKTNLSEAILINADFSRADLSDAILSQSDLRQANLRDAHLLNAICVGSDLRYADLSGADLSGAILANIQTLETNFQNTVLTGCCLDIGDPHLNIQVEGVLCDYLYRDAVYEETAQRWDLRDRCPSDRYQIFAPGELVHLIQSNFTLVELTFSQGIDWKAFWGTLQDIFPSDLVQTVQIQGIENQDTNLMVRLKLLNRFANAAIADCIQSRYEERSHQLELRYHAELQASPETILQYRHQGADLLTLITWLAHRSPNASPIQAISDRPLVALAPELGDRLPSQENVDTLTTQLSTDATLQRSLEVLHLMAQAFPDTEREEAEALLEAVQDDLPKREYPLQRYRLKACLTALLDVGMAMKGAIAAAHHFSRDVLELSEMLEISIPSLSQPSQIASPLNHRHNHRS